MISVVRFLSVIVIFVTVYEVITLFVKGKLPFTAYSDVGFDAERAHLMHAFIASQPRYIGSLHYHRCINFILDEVKKATARGIPLKIDASRGDLGVCSHGNICKLERNIDNIVVKYEGNSSDSTPLILSAHVDSHPNTAGSYDDGINVAVMLALATSEFLRNLSVPVYFAFLGSEEHGLHGSRLLMKNESTRIYGNVLNLEAMGSHMPLALVSKARKSRAVISAYAKVRGAILSTFFNDIATAPFFTSASDLLTYDEYGLHGAQLVFLGNPAVYHTEYDNDLDLEDIRMEGNVLQNFILNYSPLKEEEDVIGFGISPFALVIERSLFKKIALTTSILAISVVILMFFSSCSCGRGLGISFFVLVSFAFLAVLVNKANTVSYARDRELCFGLLALFGCLLVLIVEIHDTNDNSDGILCYHVLFYAVLLLATSNFDLGIVFLLGLIPQVVMLFIKNSFFRFFCILFAIMPITYAVAISYDILIGYVTQIPMVFADLIPLSLVAIWSLSASFMALSVSFVSKSASLRTKQFVEIIGVVYVFLVTVFLCLRQLPYSRDYLIVGTESEVIYENGSSVLSFIPIAKDRVVDGIEATMTGFLHFEPQYQGYLHRRGPAFLEFCANSSLGPWPEFKFHDEFIRDGNRGIRFQTRNVPSDIDSITLVFKCKRSICIESMEGFDEVLHRDCEFGRAVSVRIAPVESFMNFSFVVIGLDEIETDVIYTSSTLTPARRRFRDILGDYTKHFAKDRFILGDTLLLSTRVI